MTYGDDYRWMRAVSVLDRRSKTSLPSCNRSERVLCGASIWGNGQSYGLGTTDPRSGRGAVILISLVHARTRMYALPRPEAPATPRFNPELLLNTASAKTMLAVLPGWFIGIAEADISSWLHRRVRQIDNESSMPQSG